MIERATAHHRPQIELHDANAVVRDLLPPRPAIYWADLVCSSALGWLSFTLFVLPHALPLQICFYILSVICLFRCLFFIHEISHRSSAELPGFTLFWNAIVGIPLMVPSFLYEGVHLDHHRRHKYGTLEDPEYVALGLGSRLKIVLFMVQPVLFPLVFAIRFLVLAPLGLLVPPLHHFLESRLSALAINERYERKSLTPSGRRRMKMIECAILGYWGGIVWAYERGLLPGVFFFRIYLLIFGISFVNQLRTLVAHRYRNSGGEMSYEDQLLDTINIEGGIWTELWAPVGARYHALHHFIPKLPYHSLPEAHRRIKERMADNTVYGQTSEPSFQAAFRKLILG